MNEVLQVNEKFSVGFLIRKLLNQFASQVHISNNTVKIFKIHNIESKTPG